MDISDIRDKFLKGSFEFRTHAFHRSVERDISNLEIQQAEGCAEIIEYYPDDKYLPSCLVLGFSDNNRPLHLHVCYTKSDMLKIITLHEPDPELWSGFRERKRS